MNLSSNRLVWSGLFISLSLGCWGKGSSGGGDGDSAEDMLWEVMADGVGEGVLLSAWTDNNTALIVGGDLAGGSGVLVRYDGSTVCVEPEVTERALWWIHGDGAGEWMAVGEGGTVLIEVDGVRTRNDVPSESTLFGVWVEDDVAFAVGGDVDAGTGEAWRLENGEWEAIISDAPGVLFKVWDGWMVGDNVAYFWDDDTGTAEERPAGERLLTIRGRSDDDVWAVGGTASAAVLHWDGTEWEPINASGLGQPLNGVWTIGGADVWVAGNFGTTAFTDGSGWTMPDLPMTSEHFHAVWPYQDEMLFLGGNLFSMGDNYGTIGRYGAVSKSLSTEECE